MVWVLFPCWTVRLEGFRARVKVGEGVEPFPPPPPPPPPLPPLPPPPSGGGVMGQAVSRRLRPRPRTASPSRFPFIAPPSGVQFTVVRVFGEAHLVFPQSFRGGGGSLSRLLPRLLGPRGFGALEALQVFREGLRHEAEPPLPWLPHREALEREEDLPQAFGVPEDGWGAGPRPGPRSGGGGFRRRPGSPGRGRSRGSRTRGGGRRSP